MPDRTRPIRKEICLNEQELSVVRHKMNQLGTRNFGAYARITWLWIGLFALRLIVQVPLYMTNQVGWLGTTRLVMGIPFWALAIWISYLIVADPLHRHRMLEKERESTSTEGGDAHPTAQ